MTSPLRETIEYVKHEGYHGYNSDTPQPERCRGCAAIRNVERLADDLDVVVGRFKVRRGPHDLAPHEIRLEPAPFAVPHHRIEEPSLHCECEDVADALARILEAKE